MISLATITLATLFTASTAQSSVNTVYTVNYKTTDPTYTLEYSIDNTTTPIRLNNTIRVNNFNTSAWNTGTSGNGMFVGIGYGCEEMEDCDMIWCNYYVTGAVGAAGDKFTCTDVKTNSTY
jgi:hypothetical protein